MVAEPTSHRTCEPRESAPRYGARAGALQQELHRYKEQPSRLERAITRTIPRLPIRLRFERNVLQASDVVNARVQAMLTFQVHGKQRLQGSIRSEQLRSIRKSKFALERTMLARFRFQSEISESIASHHQRSQSKETATSFGLLYRSHFHLIFECIDVRNVGASPHHES